MDFSVRNFFWEEGQITDWRKKNILYFSKDKDKLIAPVRICSDIVHPESFQNLKKRFADSKELFFYAMGHLEICKKLDEAISEITHKHENIVIYPYGKNGKIYKTILNEK